MSKKKTEAFKENENSVQEMENEKNYIVGIGASAGGLEALQKLLSALPANTGFPYVIVQHLSPDYKSLLGEILGKYTEMPVIQVEDGMEIHANCVYVIQPGKNMRISNGKLWLSEQKEKELNLPIDMFFRSLAAEAGPYAISIILSGTGSDGTNGIKDIKEKDGLIIVQDLDSSKFDGMPRSAMRTGLVDTQMSPEEMALELQHISRTASKQPLPLKTEKEIDEELMKKIYLVLKQVSNINFTHYKQTTILRRIERRMMLVHKDTLSDYVNYLYESPEEVKTLSKEVLIGVTNFFRDPDYFQCLKEKAIQDILIHSIPEESIRVWVAGCSTGEEAYSIAILFCEVMDALKINRIVKIFATDLDAEAITTAGKGIYGENIVDSVSPARLSRYFSRKNSTYTVNRDIRKMIVFAPRNVFQDPPFGRLDLISCRNMLIYFQPVLQNDLFSIFHTALKTGGYLFLGKSEAIGAFTDAFPVVDAAAKIFAHRREVKIASQKAIPYLQNFYMEDELTGEAELRYSSKEPSSDLENVEQDSIDNNILEQFMPACLVVDEKNDIIHIYGDSSNFIHMPVGKFTNNLFELITDGLKIPVSTILKEAREKKTKVQYKDICFNGEQDTIEINLTAMPISKRARETGLFALVFSEKAQHTELPDAVTYDIDRLSSQRITDLEQELGDVQKRLDQSVAEQECVNEELQAANEELLTANEELQSSNEELQSVNEELYTVNAEYQQKLSELADLNDDIANFLSSTLTGIIFVDNKLNIRRYTDYVTTEFSVMDHDIGRSLKFISYHFPKVDITEICDNVLRTLVPDEREISTSRNKVFFMRVSPYRSIENKILGCVITLIDITTQKQGEVQLETTEQKLSVARDAIEAKSDYLSSITCELRTPMSALLGLVKQAKQCIEDSNELCSNLDKMTETIEYMASIVSNVSEVTQIEKEAMQKIEETFELKEVLENVSSIVEEKMQEKELKFEVSIPDDFSPTYVGNKTSLQQIILNFLSNSIKYTPKGGSVSLKIFEDTKVSVGPNQISLGIVISDTGIGIKKEFIPQIFKPFTREASTDNNETESMGLGLSIANNLINAMDGSISVESESGQGSTFTIHVMVGRYEKKKNIKKKISEKINTDISGCRVLVAEDNAINRTILCAILASQNILYEEAEDGEVAVKKYMDAPEYTYDCILMDMRMPKLDGIKATALIRESEKADAKDITIIAVSANGFSEDIKKAKQAGVDDYTTKPIDKDQLLGTMKTLIKRR